MTLKPSIRLGGQIITMGEDGRIYFMVNGSLNWHDLKSHPQTALEALEFLTLALQEAQKARETDLLAKSEVKN